MVVHGSFARVEQTHAVLTQIKIFKCHTLERYNPVCCVDMTTEVHTGGQVELGWESGLLQSVLEKRVRKPSGE